MLQMKNSRYIVCMYVHIYAYCYIYAMYNNVRINMKFQLYNGKISGWRLNYQKLKI